MTSRAEPCPAAGRYVVPDHRRHPVERAWDGDVWLDDVGPAPAGTTLPHHRRHVLGFLRSPGWILAVVFLAGSGSAYALSQIDPKRKVADGAQWLAVPLSGIAAAAVLLALLSYLDNRVAFGQVVRSIRPYVWWGILSGLVGVGFALLFEWGIPRLFDSEMHDKDVWQWIPGPAEEAGKVLVPVILWFTGRFRLPRQGFLLVVLSGITFGIFEGAEYGAAPDHFQITRPLAELMHPLLAGIVAAVAWRAAWGRDSWFTRRGVLALLAMMALHGANDGLIGLASDDKDITAVGFVTPIVFVVLYIAMKRSARQLVPPDRVPAVSPRWRPIAPRGR